MLRLNPYRRKIYVSTSASVEEIERIRRICSRPRAFCWFSTSLVFTVGKLIGYRMVFHSFEDWSQEFTKKLMPQREHEQRQSFLRLSGFSRLRSGIVLLCLYLFAQHQRMQTHSDAHCAAEAEAARKLKKLIAGFRREAKPYLCTLSEAPGLWPEDAKRVEELIKQTEQSAKLPSGKLVRNYVHRDLDHLFLQMIAYTCGHLDTSRPMQMDARSRIFQWITSQLFGPSPELAVESAMDLAQIAAWAEGTWLSIAALKKIYYEQRERASEAIERHARYHLGW